MVTEGNLTLGGEHIKPMTSGHLRPYVMWLGYLVQLLLNANYDNACLSSLTGVGAFWGKYPNTEMSLM